MWRGAQSITVHLEHPQCFNALIPAVDMGLKPAIPYQRCTSDRSLFVWINAHSHALDGGCSECGRASTELHLRRLACRAGARQGAHQRRDDSQQDSRCAADSIAAATHSCDDQRHSVGSAAVAHDPRADRWLGGCSNVGVELLASCTLLLPLLSMDAATAHTLAVR